MARILLAFDGSDGALGTVTALSHWNLHRPTEIVLLTVVPPGEWPSTRVSRMREVTARSLRRRGASVELLLREGDPIEQILGLAHERNVNLIALGPRKMTALAKLFLGSVTREVLRNRSHSVLVGRLSLLAERALVVLENESDLALIKRRLAALPLPDGLHLFLLGVGQESPERVPDLPSSLWHEGSERAQRTIRMLECQRLWRMVDEGRKLLAPVATILADATIGSLVDEILEFEKKITPELIVVRNDHSDLQDRMVAEARASVLLLR